LRAVQHRHGEIRFAAANAQNVAIDALDERASAAAIEGRMRHAHAYAVFPAYSAWFRQPWPQKA